MKNRFFAFMAIAALSSTSLLYAQGYDDDIYGTSTSSTTTTTTASTCDTKTCTASKPRAMRMRSTTNPTYKVTVQKNYQAERDVDEYNRRGVEYGYPADTTALDYNGNYDGTAFANTQRIERFYNPDVVVASNDADLIEVYYDNTPDVSITIGTGYYPRTWAWSSWYDPWYSGWYDPWYSWHSPYWYGYYSPWSWSWGLGWGWGHGWYAGWGLGLAHSMALGWLGIRLGRSSPRLGPRLGRPPRLGWSPRLEQPQLGLQWRPQRTSSGHGWRQRSLSRHKPSLGQRRQHEPCRSHW